MITPTIILGILLTVFFLSTVLMLAILPVLQRKKMGQTILEIGPSWHKSKQGTPTMGGLAPALAILLVCGTAFLLPGFFHEKEWVAVLLTLLFAFQSAFLQLLRIFPSCASLFWQGSRQNTLSRRRIFLQSGISQCS